MGKRVLVAPLNWGLGHATRCIPIIRLLLERGHTVFIASDGDSLKLLKDEFKNLTFLELPSYNIQYSRNIPAWIYTLWRTRRFLKSIKREYIAIQKIVSEQAIELIIADNRYGCWSKSIASVFVSHQLNLPVPSGLTGMGGIINFFHKRLIRKFNTIWIPDAEGSVLSGTLSQTALKAEFIGVLSRFQRSESKEAKYKLAVVLSGPEPQRTLLEKNLLPQVVALNLPSIFVRGLLNEKMGESQVEDVKIVNYLNAEELQKVIRQSEIVVARSGYSTIMDLAVLGKKAVFLPTPGQPEQEYLAKKFMQSKIAYAVDQEKLDLADALELSAEYSGFNKMDNSHLLVRAFEKLML